MVKGNSKNGIGHYLCKRTFFFSLFLVSLFTLFQAGLDYRSRMTSIPRILRRINIRQVEESLWDVDSQDLRIQTEGIIHFPYINYSAVVEDHGSVLAQAGEKKKSGVMTRIIPLTRRYNGREIALGSLYLQVDTRSVLHDVLNDIALIFVSQSVMVSMVAFLIFGLFEFTVTRHLSSAAGYFRAFDAGVNLPLKLEKEGRGDELDAMVDAFNDMRRKLDSAYRKQLNAEKKFRDLLETVRLAAVMLDQNGNITFCNDYFLSLTGWGREEALGMNWFSTFLPEEAGQRVKEVFRSVAAGESSHYENPIMTRDGRVRQIAWDNSVLRDHNGEVLGTASIGMDVTEHRKLEEQLRQAQKMEAVGQLAGGVAHDFNNILSAIVGYAHLGLMKLAQRDPMKDNLEQILAASERASALTQSLLSFSRKQVISPRPVDLNEIVKGLDKFLARLIREDIEIRMRCSGGCLSIFADKGQIEQMIINLITNARDAMPGGGRIMIDTGMLFMDGSFIDSHGFGKEGRYAFIYVSDTGQGMDEKTKRRIFEPFFTTKELGKGTGLGLSMAYGAIKQHNGYIDIYSEPGMGSTFKIYLPLLDGCAVPEDQTAEKTLQGPMEKGSGTILVAEDDEQIRRLNATVLRGNGYDVIEAVDGEDAVRKFEKNAGDVRLLITDCIMPRKNGKEAYDEIRSKAPGIKAIFLSGYAQDVISNEGLLDDGINFIVKPVTPFSLLKKVKELLS